MSNNNTQQRVRLSDKYQDREMVWRMAAQNNARRERQRQIRLGNIVPEFRMKPTPISRRQDGSWSINGGMYTA